MRTFLLFSYFTDGLVRELTPPHALTQRAEMGGVWVHAQLLHVEESSQCVCEYVLCVWESETAGEAGRDRERNRVKHGDKAQVVNSSWSRTEDSAPDGPQTRDYYAQRQRVRAKFIWSREIPRQPDGEYPPSAFGSVTGERRQVSTSDTLLSVDLYVTWNRQLCNSKPQTLPHRIMCEGRSFLKTK